MTILLEKALPLLHGRMRRAEIDTEKKEIPDSR